MTEQGRVLKMRNRSVGFVSPPRYFGWSKNPIGKRSVGRQSPPKIDGLYKLFIKEKLLLRIIGLYFYQIFGFGLGKYIERWKTILKRPKIPCIWSVTETATM